MVLHFQSDLFSNRNLRANIRTRIDTEKAQLILNRETKKTESPSWIWGKERGEKKKIEKEKKKYDGVADVTQQECNNNKYSASAYIYIYIYIYKWNSILGLLLDRSGWVYWKFGAHI